MTPEEMNQQAAAELSEQNALSEQQQIRREKL